MTDDDLEEDIAIDAMVNKARKKYQHALEHIRIRLDTIVRVKTIEQLRAGSWVEPKIDGKFKRSKLAARIASSGKYIFVNRSGMKMAEFLTHELCQYLQLGNLKILDDEALFDRALETVISNLRSMKAQA